MKIRPIGNKVLVSRVEAASVTPGGLYIPDSAKEKPIECVVVASGDGRVLDSGVVVPNGVKAGDRVLVEKWAGDDVDVGGEKRCFIKAEQIVAVIEE